MRVTMGAGLAYKDINKLKKFFNSGKATSASVKTSKQMERHLKGVANHWRISILLLISKEKDLSVENISSALDGNIKTISDHIMKLLHSGLINKKYKGRSVIHSLSPYGKRFVKFLIEFSNS